MITIGEDSLNAWFGTARNSRGVTGVCEYADGIAVVHVVTEQQTRRLLFGHFFPAVSEEDKDRVLYEAVGHGPLRGSRTVAVLPGAAYSLLQLEPPAVPESELVEAVRWSLRDLIDFPVTEAVIDLFPAPHDEQRHHTRSVYVVAARRDDVQRRIARLERAKLKVIAVDVAELALRNLAVLFPENERGVVFLYLCREAGMINLIRQENLYLTRRVFLGLDELERIGLSRDDALLADRLDQIVLEVQRSLDYYESNFAQPAVAGVVVSTCSETIPAVVPHLHQALGLPVRTIDLGAMLSGVTADSHEQERCLLAIGGALRREGEGP